MTKYTDDFFDGKRSWSFIKDKVLEGYMAPYVAKVARIGQKIVLIMAMLAQVFLRMEKLVLLLSCVEHQKDLLLVDIEPFFSI